SVDSITVPFRIHREATHGDPHHQERAGAVDPSTETSGDPAPSKPQPRGDLVSRARGPVGAGRRRCHPRSGTRRAEKTRGDQGDRHAARGAEVGRTSVIVVDTSVLVYLYVAGEHTARVETALARDPEWAAPLLWRSEFRSALMGFVRLRGLALEDAIQVSDEAERRMTGHEYMVVSHRV